MEVWVVKFADEVTLFATRKAAMSCVRYHVKVEMELTMKDMRVTKFKNTFWGDIAPVADYSSPEGEVISLLRQKVLTTW